MKGDGMWAETLFGRMRLRRRIPKESESGREKERERDKAARTTSPHRPGMIHRLLSLLGVIRTR